VDQAGERIDQWLRGVPQLHSAPQVAMKVLELTRDVNFDIRKVVDCLETDPALAARLLQVVNSARYGLSRRTTNLRQAISLIGQRSLRVLAMTFTVVEHLTKGAAAELYYSYWRRAVTMAVVGHRLSANRRDINRDDAYSAGLLADMGVLAFAQSDPNRYVPLYKRSAHGPELVEAEHATFGFAHPALGARLMERWEFPEPLIGAVRYHHGGTSEPSPLEIVVRGADLMADVLWVPQSPILESARRFLHAGFGIDTDGFIELAVGCKEDIAINAELFGVRLDANIDCQALLEEARRQQIDLSIETALDMDSLAAAFEDRAADGSP
jgi:HD-like signal output (HDOD) protein